MQNKLQNNNLFSDLDKKQKTGLQQRHKRIKFTSDEDEIIMNHV